MAQAPFSGSDFTLDIMRANSAFVVVLTGIFIGACVSGSTVHVQSSPPGESSFNPGVYSGGNGLSKETAVILETKTPVTGVPSEYAWIRHQYPGSKAVLQSLTP